MTNRWLVLNLRGMLFTKLLEQSIFQRDVKSQPRPPFNVNNASQPATPMLTSSRVNTPLVTKALPDMSIVVHSAKPLIPSTFAFAVQRPDLADNPIVQLVDMMVRVVQLATAGVIEGAGQPSDTSEVRSDSHSSSQNDSASLPHARLISELLPLPLPNAIDRLIQEGLGEVQKVLDLSNLEKMLLLVGKEGFLLDADSLCSLSELNNQYTFASEQQSSPIQQKFNSESFKSEANSALNSQADRDTLGEHVKPLGKTDNPHHELKNGERFAGRENSGNEAGRPEAGNKPSTNNNAIQMMPGQGVSVLNQQPSNILASNLSVVIQPPPVVESGQKQLPPIILPNAGLGTGNRSDRRKSKKEIREEEEREREGGAYLLDDDPLDEDLMEDE
ncbi:hypothetical protein GV64_06955 [Endozoicomonas elysicola]|uniref:Uncharacterized protein n=1 Tax=Endozoicomonas elysicola TaxID=305900 RepID=A0A081K8N4_9GAMM|nr:hypothetical protein GV64_06955 [Endozoicomonas elysicola]